MTRARGDVAVDVRPYRDADEPAVLDLLRVTLGPGPAGERRPEFFRWKHTDNPFGSSFMLLAEADGKIVGLRAFMRWRFEAAGRTLHAVRAVDTATHPDYQGKGVFSRLTRRALDDLRSEADLVFNTPNENSLRGYLKMGWQIVGHLPVWVRVRRPLRIATRHRSLREAGGTGMNGPAVHAIPAHAALNDGDDVSALLSRVARSDERIRTPRDMSYLRWRYGAAPFLDYRAVHDYVGTDLRGLGIFRVRSRGKLLESTVSELIVPEGDHGTLRRLLRRIVRAAPADYLTCRFPASWSSERASARSRLFRAPGGIRMVVNPLRDEIEPDPSAPRSWALSLGDLEVF